MTTIDPASFSPPPGFVALAERLEAAGFEAWAVGGCIRDIHVREIAGPAYPTASDWDLATNARPDDVMGLFRRTVPIGVDHGTVGVLMAGTLYEVTTFRRDIETDGRHATVSFADTIEEDLGRRDFTINALAWRVDSEDVRDPYGGLDDLRAGVCAERSASPPIGSAKITSECCVDCALPAGSTSRWSPGPTRRYATPCPG